MIKVETIFKNQKSFEDFLNEKGFKNNKNFVDERFPNAQFFELGENKLLAVQKYDNREEIKEIKDHFLIDKGLTHCVLFSSEQIFFYRNYGEIRNFVYSLRTKDNISKLDKLTKINENFDILFQVKDISKAFYENFKSKRNLVVQGIENKIKNKEKYLIAQKIFDRIFFVYFLCHKKIVRFDNGDEINGKNLFEILINNGEFVSNLYLLFQCFNNQTERILKISNFKIFIPFLNGGLFRIGTTEEKIKINLSKKDWKHVFDFLNSYHWIIEDSDEDIDEEKILTPEILGHVYERSVVEWEKKGIDTEVDDAVHNTKRKELGVYYTPESITDHICKDTIHPFVLDIFQNKYSTINDLLEKGNEHEIQTALNVLSSIHILDPACGSGAFLIKAAEIVFKLECMLCAKLNKNVTHYSVKWKIITKNIFGVDILQGATEIAKLRLWLWLISSFAEQKEITPLPNIEYNVVVGNSLIGWFDEKLLVTLEPPLTREIIAFYSGMMINANEKATKIISESLELFSTYELANYIVGYTNLFNLYKSAHTKIASQLREILLQVRSSIYLSINQSYGYHIRTKLKSKKFTWKDLKTDPFHWKFDFGDIMENGGFDIIVGNPPYGNSIPKEQRKPLECILTTLDGAEGSYNGASAFTERVKRLLKSNGYLSFIVPNSISRVKEFRKIRNFLINDYTLLQITDEGHPFDEVTLEMITVLCKNSIEKTDYNIKIKGRINSPIKTNSINTENIKKYKRIIFYQDKIWDIIAKNAKFEVLDGSRGITPKASGISDTISSKYKIPVAVSGKSIQKFRFVKEHFKWGTKDVLASPTTKESFQNTEILSTRLSFIYRVVVKPIGFVPGDNVIRIFNKTNLSVGTLILILNSNLMSYVVPKYLMNLIEFTMFINSVTDSTPIVIPKNQSPFDVCGYYLLFLNQLSEQSDRPDNDRLKQQIEFFHKLGNAMIYDLYFKEKLGTKLSSLLNKLILDKFDHVSWIELIFNDGKKIERKNIEKKNLDEINQTYEKLNNKGILNEIEKIYKNELVMEIEDP